MPHTITDLKAELKTVVVEDIEKAINLLRQYLIDGSQHHRLVLQLKGRYNKVRQDEIMGLRSEADLDLELNRIRNAILELIELVGEDDIQHKTEVQKGEILYSIPSEMLIGKARKCLVRIAYTREILLQDLTLAENPEIESIRIAAVMDVELIDISGNQNFSVTAVSSDEQYLDKDDYTEWVFYVTPLRLGQFPLLLKVSTLQTIKGKERRKDIVLEKLIAIKSELPASPSNDLQQLGKPFIRSNPGHRMQDDEFLSIDEEEASAENPAPSSPRIPPVKPSAVLKPSPAAPPGEPAVMPKREEPVLHRPPDSRPLNSPDSGDDFGVPRAKGQNWILIIMALAVLFTIGYIIYIWLG